MGISNDNKLETQAAGQADWDSALTANFNILERGFHLTGLAGGAVSTGDVLWMNSGGYLFRFDARSTTIRPKALAFTAAASGESFQTILTGIVRSLGVHSLSQMGADMFVSPGSPGMIARSYSAASRKIGWGVGDWGMYFNPSDDFLPEKLTLVTTVNLVINSLHYFTLDPGARGINRQVKMVGASGDLVSLLFHASSSRANGDRLFETKSGGVSVVGSFIDQAMWPYENTDPSTLSGIIYGTMQLRSGALVTSDSVGVTGIFERLK